eukprot:scaffold13618_cov101-Isochrysis_galbana.AAC.1
MRIPSSVSCRPLPRIFALVSIQNADGTVASRSRRASRLGSEEPDEARSSFQRAARSGFA